CRCSLLQKKQVVLQYMLFEKFVELLSHLHTLLALNDRRKNHNLDLFHPTYSTSNVNFGQQPTVQYLPSLEAISVPCSQNRYLTAEPHQSYPSSKPLVLTNLDSPVCRRTPLLKFFQER